MGAHGSVHLDKVIPRLSCRQETAYNLVQILIFHQIRPVLLVENSVAILDLNYRGPIIILSRISGGAPLKAAQFEGLKTP